MKDFLYRKESYKQINASLASGDDGIDGVIMEDELVASGVKSSYRPDICSRGR
jgi:hypothetical protein